MTTPKYKRILLKLSGEALMGDGKYGISPKTLGAIASSQANVIVADRDTRGTFLLLRNNAAGLSRVEFADSAERSLETRADGLGQGPDRPSQVFARPLPGRHGPIPLRQRRP